MKQRTLMLALTVFAVLLPFTKPWHANALWAFGSAALEGGAVAAALLLALADAFRDDFFA
jgi:hypothetical protein